MSLKQGLKRFNYFQEMIKFLLITIIISPFVGKSLILYVNQDTEIITVEKLERVSQDNEESKYLIFTEKETFENTDALIFRKFNSSDIYGKMKEGNTYEVKVAGLRIPLLSWYRNIIDIKEVKKNTSIYSTKSLSEK